MTYHNQTKKLTTWFLTGHDGSGVMHLGNMQACLGNMRARLGKPGKSFFIPKVCGHLKAVGYMIVPEAFRGGRQGLEPRGTWQHQSLMSKEAGSKAMGHVAAL
jgi:hypothetical protein